jgi:stage III sporulation protein AF
VAFLTEWITNIIVFVLLATIIDMLLPSSNMKKYTKIVTGLLLITIILTPLLKLLSSDFDDVVNEMTLSSDSTNNSVENLIEIKKKEIQASQRAYILEQMGVQMKQEVEKEMIEEHGKQVVTVSLEAEDENLENLPESISKVTVVLAEPQEEGAVETVKRVDISTRDGAKKDETDHETSQLASALAKIWNLPKDQIVVIVQGGMGEGNEL